MNAVHGSPLELLLCLVAAAVFALLIYRFMD